MISDRPFPAAITVALVDGRTLSGRVAQFSPYIPDLTLDVDDDGADVRSRRVVLRGELVAYVAFRSALGALPPRPNGLLRYRIHIVGGKMVPVEAPSGQHSNPLGFYAFPVESDWDVREYFFYTHGVLRREIDAPIGEMLVEQGIVAEEQIKRGLAVQAHERFRSLTQILNDHDKVLPGEQAALALQRRRRLRLDEVLLEAGLATQADLDVALAEQAGGKGKRFGEILMDLGIVREEDLMRTLAKKFGLEFIDLDEHPVQAQAAKGFPRGLIENLGVLPIYADSAKVILAISDPMAFQSADLLRNQVKKNIVEVLVAPSQLQRYIELALTTEKPSAPPIDDDIGVILKDLADDDTGVVADDRPEEPEVGESDSGIIKLVNKIIIDAFRKGASDIHLEPNGRERNMVVRFRIDGDCTNYHEIPPAVRNAVVARLKIMAGLDISERRKPQDGKIRFRMSERVIELRVATLPTVDDNEDVVMRVLASSKPLPLDNMGLATRNLRELKAAMDHPYGLVLCVGPTGSGKTTTLHSMLGSINTPDRKIWTAEDPVEITQPGLRQVQVKPKVGYTFEVAMRAFLRADPDVIMVGEMRDLETAGTAVEASLTGHLVLSTLHTNSAPETITRLLDMGLDPFSFADALIAVLAQRLARALCPKCKVQRAGTSDEYGEVVQGYGQEALVSNLRIRSVRDLTLWRAPGCGHCGKAGYKGRLGIHELLVTDDEIKRAIAHKTSVAQLRELAVKAGMTTLLQDGIEKAIAGTTDLTQVFAVCGKR